MKPVATSSTTPCKPKYSNTSDTDTAESPAKSDVSLVSNADMNIASKFVPAVEIDKKPIGLQLPYHDHQYSRISFYGSGITEENEKKQENVSVHIGQTLVTNTIVKSTPKTTTKTTTRTTTKTSTKSTPKSVSKVATKITPKAVKKVTPKIVTGSVSKKNLGGGESLLKPREVPPLQPLLYRFNPTNGLRQTSPANVMPKIVVPSTTVPLPTTVVRPNNYRSTVIRNTNMFQPVAYSNQSIFMNSPMQVNFQHPVTVVQRSVIRQPVYYVSLCEPPKSRFPTTHFH